MMKTITKFMTLCAIGVCSVTASAQSLSEEYVLPGYKVKAFYDLTLSTATEYIPTEGDLRYRPNAGKEGLHNYGGGARECSVKIPAKTNNLLLIEGVNTSGNEVPQFSVSDCTADEQYKSGNIYAYKATKDFSSFTLSVARYICVKRILVMEVNTEATTANYKVKFVDENSVELKDAEVRNGVVDASINLLTSDKSFFVEGQKYIYVSDDSEDKTIASDSSTVVTVTYREAATYHYSVEAKLEGIDETQAIMDGVVFEGESVTIPFSMHQVSSDGVLYKTNGIDDNKKQYNYTITPTEDNQIIYIEYTTTDVTDVVFFKEAENIESMISSIGNSGTAGIRSSNSKVAYAKENNVKVVDLPAGKYTIYADIYGGQNATGELSVMIGEQTKTFTSVSNTYHSLQSWDVDIASPDALYILPGGGNGVAFDYIYIVRTGESTAVESIKAEQPADDNYYDLSGRKVANPVKGNIYINGGKLIRY